MCNPLMCKPHEYEHTCTYIHVCIYVYIYLYIYPYIHVHICQVFMYARPKTSKLTCFLLSLKFCENLNTCIYVYIYLYIYPYIHIQSIYISIYTHTYMSCIYVCSSQDEQTDLFLTFIESLRKSDNDVARLESCYMYT